MGYSKFFGCVISGKFVDSCSSESMKKTPYFPHFKATKPIFFILVAEIQLKWKYFSGSSHREHRFVARCIITADII